MREGRQTAPLRGDITKGFMFFCFRFSLCPVCVKSQQCFPHVDRKKPTEKDVKIFDEAHSPKDRWKGEL